MTQRINFGWKPQFPDHRDMLFRVGVAQPLPSSVDLVNELMPPVYDQGELGSCVANATAAAMVYEHAKQKALRGEPHAAYDRAKTMSRLFLYYGARALENSTDVDSGCMIRDVMKVAYNQGAPVETSWPYDTSKFQQTPPHRSYLSARNHKITGYRAVQPQDLYGIKKALVDGYTVVIGVSVFESFYQGDQTGLIPLPSQNEPFLGGHAILLVGYDDATNTFKFRNSWGPSWGHRGYGYLPYSYVTNPDLGGDYWVVIDDQYKERME